MRVLQVIAFAPRGGSAQVVRYLSKALITLGVDTTILSGSLRRERQMADASRFFEGLRVFEVDYSEARDGFDRGIDPMSPSFASPMSPSYEDRSGVPDRVFYRVGAAGQEHLINAWRRVLGETTLSFRPDVLHLHHLHHAHLAAIDMPALAQTPKVAHLHGTELKMLRQMKQLADDASLHVGLWEKALRRATDGVDRLIVNSDAVASEARDLLAVGDERISVIPNGVDVEVFRPRHWSRDDRLRHLKRLLVESPLGWDESGVEGSIRYQEDDLRVLLDEAGELKPIILYAGRFLAFKRVDLLLETVFEISRSASATSAFNVLICGGAPGEWEGEHPYAQAKRLGLRNVFFCGWLEHEDLAQALNVADAFVAPSSYEPFGQVYLEAMATGLPVVATRSGGPPSFIVDKGETASGWLCAPDDGGSLRIALDHTLSDATERRRRGANGNELVRRRYSWDGIARQFEDLYNRLVRESDFRRTSCGD